MRIGYGFSRVPGSRPGSKRAKMAQKNRKQLIHFMVWSAGCSLLRAEGLSCSLEVLHGGQFFFLQFLVIKTLDPYPNLEPDPYPDPYPDSLIMLDSDSYPDPQHWFHNIYSNDDVHSDKKFSPGTLSSLSISLRRGNAPMCNHHH